MSAYYTSPGGSPPQDTAEDQLAPVLVAFAGPARQSRLTVLIRLLMIIPHAIVLWALGIAAYVVVIIGWFGALFTAQLPRFAADYLSGYLRWQTRVFGYGILLTDVYPPFTLEDDPTYPVRVAIPEPQRLNRAAVLFTKFLGAGGKLPSPWKLTNQTATFYKPSNPTRSAFRIEPLDGSGRR